MKGVCKYCGNPIPPTRRSNARYCSNNCQRKAWANPQKAAERSKKILPYKENVYLAYESKCAICGWRIPPQIVRGTYTEVSGGCQIHHIISVCKGGEESADNLILLCPNCHKMAGCGAISAEEIRKHLKPFLTKEQKRERYDKISSANAARIAAAIFGDGK